MYLKISENVDLYYNFSDNRGIQDFIFKIPILKNLFIPEIFEAT